MARADAHWCVVGVQLEAPQLTEVAANTHAAADGAMSWHWAPHVPVPAQGARAPCGGPDPTGEQIQRPGATSHA